MTRPLTSNLTSGWETELHCHLWLKVSMLWPLRCDVTLLWHIPKYTLSLQQVEKLKAIKYKIFSSKTLIQNDLREKNLEDNQFYTSWIFPCYELNLVMNNGFKGVHAQSSSFTAPLGYVSNFKVTSYTSTSIDMEWSPIVGATEYKLSWKTGGILVLTVRVVVSQL